MMMLIIVRAWTRRSWLGGATCIRGDEHSARLCASPLRGASWRRSWNPGKFDACPTSFSLFDAPPVTDRLFFAIFPDPATATRIAQATTATLRSPQLSGRPLAPERFHITLHHLGDHAGVRRDIVAMASEAAEAITTAPFEVTFDRAASFHNGGNNPFVLQGGEGLEALKAFQRDLGLAMARAGLGKLGGQGVHAARDDALRQRLVAEQAIEPVTWTVGGFTLIHSLLGRTEHIRWGAGRCAEGAYRSFDQAEPIAASRIV
jgi:2'-5' RNA ligase